jgi:hypothetical protein
MLRKTLGLVVVVLVAGLAMGQPKGTKKETKKVVGTKATVSKVDVDKRTLEVTIDGKKQTFAITKAVTFHGPKGGKREKGIRDDALTVEATVTLVFDSTGKVLKEVHLPVRRPMRKPAKDKPAKDK